MRRKESLSFRIRAGDFESKNSALILPMRCLHCGVLINQYGISCPNCGDEDPFDTGYQEYDNDDLGHPGNPIYYGSS